MTQIDTEELNDNDTSPLKRDIRSFVIRSGRMTNSQRESLDKHLEKWSLSPNEKITSKQAIFGNNNPLTVEIGFGMGDTLAQMALESPEVNFIGIEVHRAGVGRLLRLVEEKQLNNIRVYSHDAVAILKNNIPTNIIDRVNIFFPDPWHKRRHHKRRLIRPDFLAMLNSRMKKEGILHIATDWQPYAESILTTLGKIAFFENVAGNQQFVKPSTYGRPETKFERRGHKLGHGSWDMVFKHCP